MAVIDFNNVQVANQTAAWLRTSPVGDFQWLPNTGPTPTNTTTEAVENNYGGIIYHYGGPNIQLNAPQWASWTACTDAALELTIYTPQATEAAEAGESPTSPKAVTLNAAKAGE